MIEASVIGSLKFREGLIPAIVQDAKSGRVLTLAYMSPESLRLSIEEQRTVFWSRSRNEIWRKGETSGNIQHITDITPDCDGDALLILVKPEGPACHSGAESCFGEDGAARYDFSQSGDVIGELYELLKDRRVNPKEGSYTSYLYEKGLDKILKKIGEESTEVIIGAKNDENREAKSETIYELTDLAYHALVLMSYLGINPEEIETELRSRHVVDKKTKQEPMR